MIGLALLPFRIVFGTGWLALRTGWWAGRTTTRVTRRTLGVRGLLALGAGVGVGLLVAPRPGTETRRALRWWVEGRRPSDQTSTIA